MTIPPQPAGRLDPARLAIQVAMYVVIMWLTREIVGSMIVWLGGYFLGGLGGNLAIAAIANLLVLRFFTTRGLVDLGLWWNRASMENLAFGILGGAGAACLVLGPAILARAARIAGTPNDRPSFGVLVFVAALLALGAMGEELMMRGYGFQILLVNCGTWATILPVGVVFALLHTGNPNATWLGMANTAGFGILFGYAYVRSRDLWLPAGLHFGWNLTLPLFGANVSGLTMKVTGHEMVWSAGKLWSGGEYGPEASVLTSAMMAVLAVYLWKAPIRRQVSPLTGPLADDPVVRENVRQKGEPCEPLL
jgi:membrane protease YdiL (CAAX protease family)